MIILAFLVFGMFAGWIASIVLHDRSTRAQQLIAGLVGSFVGGTIAALVSGDGFDINPSGLIGSIVGAIVEIRPINPVLSGEIIETTPVGSSRLKLKCELLTGLTLEKICWNLSAQPA